MSIARLGPVVGLSLVATTVIGCGGSTPPHGDVVSFNYCGNVCAAGSDEGAGFVAGLVEESGARAVVLQEICRSQAEHLQGALARVWDEAALAYVTTFAGDLGGANQCRDDNYGMAIIAPSVTAERTLPLPNPGLGRTQIDERALLCADLDHVVTCTTHLVRPANDSAAHNAQVEALLAHATDLAAEGRAIVIAGDMNDSPSRFEALTASGAFIADSHDRIDQVFATRSHFDDVSIMGRGCRCSDHDALVIDLDRAARSP